MTAPAPPPPVAAPGDPTPFNGATVHGLRGERRIRHLQEVPFLAVAGVLCLGAYLLWLATLLDLVLEVVQGEEPSLILGGSLFAQAFTILMVLPLVLWIARAYQYARLRTSAVRMSPTQFPEGYRMVAEAAQRSGMRRVPDAYVVSGSGVINAFATGHGLRRFIVVHSDLFEVGGAARDPQAVRFIIGHEVGHLAAGHVSWARLLITFTMSQVPVLGVALTRAQEYTADNFGYAYCPDGAAGAMALLSAGKYLNADVNVHELADRAVSDTGFWAHTPQWLSTHPIITWRAHALRDRSRHGSMWLRPKHSSYAPTLTPPSAYTRVYPTPAQALGLLDQVSHAQQGEAHEQFGRYPGVDYTGRPTVRQQQVAAPGTAWPRLDSAG